MAIMDSKYLKNAFATRRQWWWRRKVSLVCLFVCLKKQPFVAWNCCCCVKPNTICHKCNFLPFELPFFEIEKRNVPHTTDLIPFTIALYGAMASFEKYVYHCKWRLFKWIQFIILSERVSERAEWFSNRISFWMAKKKATQQQPAGFNANQICTNLINYVQFKVWPREMCAVHAFMWLGCLVYSSDPIHIDIYWM